MNRSRKVVGGIWVPDDLRIKLDARRGQRLAQGPFESRRNRINYIVGRRDRGLLGRVVDVEGGRPIRREDVA